MKNFRKTEELTALDHTIISVALDNFIKEKTALIHRGEIENWFQPDLYKRVKNLQKKWDAIDGPFTAFKDDV